MTIFISIFGFIGRAAGRLLTTALGWASGLLFGRVRPSHQIFVTLSMAGSLLCVAMIAAALLPGVTSFLLASTPHPGVIGIAFVRLLVFLGLLFLPLAVGLAGYLAPEPDDRPEVLAVSRQFVAGYPITFVMTPILIFLAGVAVARKARTPGSDGPTRTFRWLINPAATSGW